MNDRRTKYAAVENRTILFGLESDLRMNSYAVLNVKKGERVTAGRINEDSMRFNTLEQATLEAKLCVVEQGRKQDFFVVYAIRTNRMGDIEEFEAMTSFKKYPMQVAQ